MLDEMTLCNARSGNGVPKHFTIGQSIGKGANNEVFLAYNTKTQEHCVFRKPLKNADSRARDYAMREAYYSMLASKLSVAPLIQDIWYVRKSNMSQRKGLYMISQKLDLDLTAIIKNDISFVLRNIHNLRKKTTEHIRTIADSGLFAYDLKPANSVCNTQAFDIKLIDFGADYCEHLDDKEPGKIITYLKTEASKLFPTEKVRKECCNAFFIVMCVIYSAHLYGTVRSYDLGLYVTQVWAVNYMVSVIIDYQKQMSPEQKQLACKLLEHKELRKQFEHYFDIDKSESHLKVCRRARFTFLE